MNEPVIIPRRPSLTKAQRVRIFDAAGGVCHLCGLKIHATRERWEAEHVEARAISGRDDLGNLKPAHVECHKVKTAADKKDIAKVIRQRAKHLGIRKTSTFACSRNTPFKKKLNGQVVRRHP